MIDSNIINSRIAKLREYLKILRELSKENEKDFTENYKIYGLAERYLQLAIECVLDIGNHMISRLEFKKPETYQDILLILGKNSILPVEFSEKIAKMAGFRNILVHGYTDIDKSIVYDHLKEDLTDFEKFIQYITQYLKNQTNDN
jgi:uncharacterized protein YutE (UPF0331/DUF86 family)